MHCCQRQNNQPAISVAVTERVEQNSTSNNSHPRKTVGIPKTMSPWENTQTQPCGGEREDTLKIIQPVTKQINKQINKQMITSPGGRGGRVSSVAKLYYPRSPVSNKKIMRHAKKYINMTHSPETKQAALRHFLSVWLNVGFNRWVSQSSHHKYAHRTKRKLR